MNGVENPLAILVDVLSVSQKIALERSLDDQLEMVIQTARSISSAESGCIYLLDKTKRFLVPQSCQGNLFDNNEIRLQRIALSESISSRQVTAPLYCAVTGNLVNIDDIYTYSGFCFKEYYQNDLLTGRKTKSLLSVPLTDKKGVSTGVLMLYNHTLSTRDTVSTFPKELEALVSGFAAIAAIAITNLQLINENQELLKQQSDLNQLLIVENKELKGRIYQTLQLDQIIGRSPAMEKVFGLIEKVASSTATVCLNGETGTGKELFAATIHQNSPVRDGKFIAQNCAAFPPDLLESEMFGYHKGAFSGATTNKKGLFEAAHKGTLFLDEIGEMPMSLQSKLLRVLQEGEVRPLGSNETIKVQVRIIAATNRSLIDMIKKGTFREDLYYRLNVFPIQLPSLRERAADIPALTHYFIDKYAKQYGKDIKKLDPKVLDFLQSYHYPGNVRELQNIIERAVILVGSGSVLHFDCLPPELREASANHVNQEVVAEFHNQSLKDVVNAYEANILRKKLNENQGNQSLTAKQLGLSRRSLVEKISRFNLRRTSA